MVKFQQSMKKESHEIGLLKHYTFCFVRDMHNFLKAQMLNTVVCRWRLSMICNNPPIIELFFDVVANVICLSWPGLLGWLC